MAAIALVAEDEAVPSTGLAHARFRCGQAFHELLELAGLVELPDLLGPTHVPTADEHPRQGQLPPPQNLLQLDQEARVHRQIPLVDRHAEPPEDRSDRPAVLERRPDHAQAREVNHHALLRSGDADRRRLLRSGLRLGLGEGASRPGAKERVGDSDAVEDGEGFLGGGGGAGEVGGRLVCAEAHYVFE